MTKTLISAAALTLVAFTSGCSGESESSESGSCGGQRWTLSAETENDLTEVSFELDTATAGETWQIDIVRGDETILDTTATSDEDRELDVDLTVDAVDGKSTITVTATPESGDACTATVEHG